MAAFLKKSSSTTTIDLTQSDEEGMKPAALATPAHMLNAAKRKKAMAFLHRSGSVQLKKVSSAPLPQKARKSLPSMKPKEKKYIFDVLKTNEKKSVFDVDSDSSDDCLPLAQAAKTPPKINKIHVRRFLSSVARRLPL